MLPAFQDSDKNVIRIKIWIAFKKAQIPIEIRYPPQPVLFNSKNSKLEDLVTICIKTFERYPCLNRLIESIEAKYPKINIIIADDSFNYQSLETKNYQNVVQYQMPGGTGFNKGKNLAISQVCLYIHLLFIYPLFQIILFEWNILNVTFIPCSDTLMLSMHCSRREFHHDFREFKNFKSDKTCI